MADQRYLVTARKYRPSLFREVVAQQHVTDTLKNALRLDRLAHAYLFSGPRGVGKTTTARILAKAINCETPREDREDQAEPCCECDSCLSFEEGRSLNVFEMDAASNNKVDDIRDLRETVRIPPQGSTKKVYILDEVHMLSKSAFNALLKTLEEPPPHALFIFATTEPHKVLPTILSRCQRFDFRRIPVPKVVSHLRTICKEEGIEADEESLMLLARKGEGALRDALSAFDQAISLCGTTLEYGDLTQALGVVDQELYFTLTDHVATQDTAGVLKLVHHVVRSGHDLQEFLGGLAEHLRNLLVARSLDGEALEDVAESTRARYAKDAQRFSEADLLRLLTIAGDAENEVKNSSQPRLKLEMTLLKMVKMRRSVDLKAVLRKISRLEQMVESGDLPERLPSAAAAEPTPAEPTASEPATSEPTTSESAASAPQSEDAGASAVQEPPTGYEAGPSTSAPSESSRSRPPASSGSASSESAPSESAPSESAPSEKPSESAPSESKPSESKPAGSGASAGAEFEASPPSASQAEASPPADEGAADGSTADAPTADASTADASTAGESAAGESADSGSSTGDATSSSADPSSAPDMFGTPVEPEADAGGDADDGANEADADDAPAPGADAGDADDGPSGGSGGSGGGSGDGDIGYPSLFDSPALSNRKKKKRADDDGDGSSDARSSSQGDGQSAGGPSAQATLVAEPTNDTAADLAGAHGVDAIEAKWPAFVQRVMKDRIRLGALLSDTAPESMKHGRLTIGVPKALHRDALRDDHRTLLEHLTATVDVEVDELSFRVRETETEPAAASSPEDDALISPRDRLEELRSTYDALNVLFDDFGAELVW